mmetsp:Transcript_18273/g.25750  ORF Transcript_18273/g.25750 Transcript_18273/m.25750 type:complete len:278 (+) Transcript_18273:155-988(+)
MIVRHISRALLLCFFLSLVGTNKAFLTESFAKILGRDHRSLFVRAPFYASSSYNNNENEPKQQQKQDNNDDASSSSISSGPPPSGDLGGYNPGDKLELQRESVVVGDPQIKVKKKEPSIEQILQELAMIQKQGPKKYCILGTRHCSFLHQQIIELLAYALVLSGNQVWTSGAGGTHMATIRGALRAGNDDLLHVVIPQSLSKQPKESRELLNDVTNLIQFPERDEMSLTVASQFCNSYMLNNTDQLIAFAFHESSTVIEATKEAKENDLVVTTLYLD